MKELVQNFTRQLEEAMQIGAQAQLRKPAGPIRNVIITGLGGSGIGGTIVAELVAHECPVPVVVNKDYFLPAFTGPETLVIVSSYSGNTEETIQAMELAIAKKAHIVCVTSGGKIAELAKASGSDLILIPGGMPPRSCLGYSLTQLLYIFQAMGLSGAAFRDQLKAAIDRLRLEEAAVKAEAEAMTKFLHGKLPVIYAVDGYNGVATRFRQQINENSKMLCWHHILPEMNHNELVGWADQHPECAVIFLRSSNDYVRTQKRVEISKEVISRKTPHVLELWSKGESQLERALYLIHLTDWVSCYLADKKAIDATEVEIINHLKGELSRL